MYHNWRNYYKKLELSDAQNTRKINAFFSKQKWCETWELAVTEQSKKRLPSSDTVIDFVEQSETEPLASTSSAKSQFTYVAESETCFEICILTLYFSPNI